MDEEGNAGDLGLEATQLFDTGPPSLQAAGKEDDSAAVGLAEEGEGADEPVSFRKAKSRRKAPPAQSLPAEQLLPPAQVFTLNPQVQNLHARTSVTLALGWRSSSGVVCAPVSCCLRCPRISSYHSR